MPTPLIYKGFHALPVAIVSSLVVILTSGLNCGECVYDA